MEVQRVKIHWENDIYCIAGTSSIWPKQTSMDIAKKMACFLSIRQWQVRTVKDGCRKRGGGEGMASGKSRIADTLSIHSTKLTQMATTCHLNLFTTIYCYCIVCFRLGASFVITILWFEAHIFYGWMCVCVYVFMCVCRMLVLFGAGIH